MTYTLYLLKSMPALILSFLACASYAQDYFQQEVDYDIEVKLNDQKHMLTGYEKIEYTNNSPDELSFIYFHLWPNAYKNNQTTLAGEQLKSTGKHYLFDKKEQRGFIDSLTFRVNERKVSWEFHPHHIDICKVILNEPLESGETITITTPFRVKIPLGVTSRLGHIDQSYKITQWYPKPAVYDHQGWHPMPYRDMGEFYSEFGSFDVTITIPDNYVVAATGQLQTESELEWLTNRAVESKGRFSFDWNDMDFPRSADKKKTIRYTIDQAHDFAWFADKRYHVMKDSVSLPNSGRTVTTWTYFTNDQAELWRKATNYINDALGYYSKWYGDYPWNNCSAVLGAAGGRGNGMEYPTITVIGHTQQPRMLEMVIMHEVGHNWFYGMLGFNERRYPYLDEGLNTFSEIRYMQNKYENDDELYKMFEMDHGLAKLMGGESFGFKYLHELTYLLLARQNMDQPINTPSEEFSLTNYGAIAYSKTGLAFHHLMKYLGEEKFDETMRDFFQKWKFKHPYPGDLQKAFKKHTNKNTDWFFDDMLTTTGKVDYKIARAKDNHVLIKNKADINAPLILAGFKDGRKTFSRWYQGFEGSQWLEIPSSGSDKYIIDPDKSMVELYRHNNTLSTDRWFGKIEPLKLQFFGLFNNPGLTQIHYLPSLGWNYYDKTMIGALLYDAVLPPDKLDYYLLPMYSTGNKSFSGTGKVAFNLFPNHTFRQIQLKISGKQFAYDEASNKTFNRIRSGAVFTLNKPNPREKVTNEIRFTTTRATDINDILTKAEKTNHQWYHKLTLLHDKSNRTIHPYSINTNIELGENFLKSSFEAKFKYSYYKNEGIRARLFGGTFLYKKNNLPWSHAFHLSGGSGLYDYAFDHTFLGRFEDPTDEIDNQLLSQQFYPDDGAFALYSPIGITKDWLLSLNLSANVPVIRDIPLEVYANMGTFGKSKFLSLNISNTNWAMESGVKLSFLRFMDIYFPVAASHNLQKASTHISSRYGEKIRFHLRFDLYKPSEMLKKLNL